MGNRRLFSTLGSYLVSTRFLAPMATTKIGLQDSPYMSLTWASSDLGPGLTKKIIY